MRKYEKWEKGIIFSLFLLWYINYSTIHLNAFYHKEKRAD